MSMVPIVPQNFAQSATRVSEYMAKKKMRRSDFEITSRYQYGAGDPYVSYLQSGETGVRGDNLVIHHESVSNS